MKTKEEILGKICGMTIDESAYRIQTKTEYILLAMEEYAKEYHEEHRIKTIEKDCTCYVEPFEMMHDPKCVLHGDNKK